jgi:hypothetical protein
MSGPLVSASAAFVAKNSRIPPFAIEQSLRFDSGSTSTLTRTPSSNGGSIHTTSAWIKAADPTLMANIFAAYPSESAYGTSTTYDILGWYSEGPYSYVGNGPGNESSLYLGAIDYSYKFRDSSAWYHVIWVSTSTQLQIYVNGVLVASKSRTQNNSYYNQNRPHRISAYRAPNGSLGGYINCYMAEVHFVDGQALDHEDFGEFDDNGVWRPIEYTGSYGTNGFYLKFDPSATNGIGHDHSGNGNNWTPTNFDTTNTTAATYDVMSDTPTTNWCTLNPLEKPGGTAPVYENGNLTLRNSTNYFFSHGVGTFALNSGKWYFETSGDTSIYVQIGFLDSSQITSMTGGGGISGANISWHYQSNGIIRGLSSTYQDTGLTAASTAGDIMGLAIDFDAGEASWYVNGTQVGSTVDFSSYLASGRTWYPVVAVTNEGTDITNVNFGQRAFAYTPPTGFKPLNTSNLSAPTVKDGSKNFNTLLYTGTGGTKAISGAGFQPDFVWIKNRSRASSSHVLVDAVRGATKALSSNLTTAEVTTNGTDDFRSFDSDGFTVGDSSNYFVNSIGDTHVAWSWDAGGSGSSNTDGSITSTVSVNPSAGFSIVSYTGNGQSGATVGHGLGVAPKMIIVKDRDAGRDWAVYHTALGATKNLYLNLTNSTATDSGVWTNTEPSSTVFTVGTSAYTNYGNLLTGDDFIAYCFAEVESYSKIGSYIGNGNADGPFVFCGFRPSMIIYKNSSVSSDWTIVDAARSPYNEVDVILDPSASTTEGSFGTTNRNIDFLSNGFKIRSTAAGGTTALNGSGNTMIFAAFAENPFGGSGVSPATAR